jgi:thioesterase domain-containing protein
MPCGATAPPEDWLDLSQYSKQQQQVWDIHLQALLKHQPRAYAGGVTLFRTPVHLLFCSFEADYGWKDCVRGGVTQKIIPGAHETIMEEPGVQNLAKAMNESLAQSMGVTPS